MHRFGIWKDTQTQTSIDHRKTTARLKSINSKAKASLLHHLILSPHFVTTAFYKANDNKFIATYIYIYSYIWIMMHCHILNHRRKWFLGFLFWRWKEEVFCRSVEKIPYHCIINWKPLFFGSSQPEMASGSPSSQPVTMINKSPNCLGMVFPAIIESALLGFRKKKQP